MIMKTKQSIYLLAVVVMMLLVTGCSPDAFSLGGKDLSSDDLVEGIAYEIKHDVSNPNIVIVKSLLPSGYAVIMDTPQGRYQSSEVTLKIPFSGTYKIRMGAETRGGFVWGPYATFTVKDFFAGFVNDPLWTKISGGVGHSKRWKLDIDANTVTKHTDLWAGPLGFWGVDDNWNSVMLGQKIAGDSWNWTPDIAGNGWVMRPMDYGYMEFDLKDGAHVTVYNAETGKTMRGTYMLDTENHTITFSDAQLLHNSGHDGVVTNWSASLSLFGLDDDRLQIAALRDNSSEKPCRLCYNFVSQEYWDNWKPNPGTGTADVQPKLIEGWQNLIENPTNREITYKLAKDDQGAAFDYCNLDGTPKGLTFTAASGIEDAKLVIYYGTNAESRTYTYTAPDGSQVKGTYTLSNEGVITFSKGLGNTALAANFNMSANADNSLRVLSVSTDAYSGALKDLWLGKSCVDDQGQRFQYQGYHWVAQTKGAADVKRYTGKLYIFDSGFNAMSSAPTFITTDGNYTFTLKGKQTDAYGVYLDVPKLYKDHHNCDVKIVSIKVDGHSVPFDDTAINRGTADNDHSTARRYLVNPWGDTKNDKQYYNFSDAVVVTVKVTLDCGTNVMEP